VLKKLPPYHGAGSEANRKSNSGSDVEMADAPFLAFL
jgi:hypothetical protein